MNIFGILTMIGGLAMFLYGMSVMGGGLEKMSGGKLERILESLTSNPFKAVLLGAGVTAVIQSSSATTVMVVGFVNSGIMKLSQAIGIIMGANIGTTVTGQLIRMADISGDSLILTLIQPKTFAPVVAFVGCIFYVFLRNAKKKNIGQIMLGFGILFTGMSLMDTGVSPLRESAAFQNPFVTMTNPILGVLVGLVVIQLFPANILGLFEASPDMLAIGVPALRIISLCFVFAGFSIICSSTFQALGNGLLSMMISIVRQLLILLPAAFFLSLSGSVTAVWWAFPIAELASLALCVIFLRRIYRRVILPLE